MDTDVSLLDAARRMDREALVKIFDLYSQALYGYALRLCSDPLLADYVVGDVFAKLLDQFSAGLGPTSNLRSYLYEITYHIVVDDARYYQRRTPLEVLDTFRDERYATSMNIEDRLVFENILQSIRKDLTPDQRHVIILRFLEGFSVQETAAIIGKEVSNVKVIQNRAIAVLRKAVGYVVL